MDERLGTPNEEGKLRQANAILRAALFGVRGLAAVEVAATGSPTWRKAIQEIDRCIKDAAA